ncbi:hypothetical protein GS435_10490 [Rhodococcus hoagii]|nr:hypothetical protein [Prescottella equi]NKV88654.1 hypothetical protein [Prescottella equi]
MPRLRGRRCFGGSAGAAGGRGGAGGCGLRGAGGIRRGSAYGRGVWVGA